MVLAHVKRPAPTQGSADLKNKGTKFDFWPICRIVAGSPGPLRQCPKDCFVPLWQLEFPALRARELEFLVDIFEV
jgi:hypothetical protein